MRVREFIPQLVKFHSLNISQQENMRNLIEISRTFRSGARISVTPQDSIETDTIVLESGHQPNFLPYSGVWKKAFVLDSIRKELSVGGNNAIAIFGFSDHTLSTAPYLYQNQIPAYKKQGKEKIGFKISEQDRWKCFNYLKKPDEEHFTREMEKIKRSYLESFRYLNIDVDILKHRMDDILELLFRSYHLAESFADFNAFCFSGICAEVFDLQLNFFRYSDVWDSGLLMNECKKILSKPEIYNAKLTAAINKNGLMLPPVKEDSLPFWYHCDCGGKIHLSAGNSSKIRGTCPVCKKEYTLSFGPNLDSLGNYYSRMSPNAIARNIVFSEGFGTTLFISGTGGGLRYGQVAETVSKEMGFHHPLTLAWRSADLYLGAVHIRAIHELMKTFQLKILDILDTRINEKMRDYRNSLSQQANEMEDMKKDKKEIQKIRGKYLNSLVQAETIRNVFSETPSLLDILITFEPALISEKWKDTLEKVDIRPEGYWLSIQGDVLYPCKGIQSIVNTDIPVIYRAMGSIEVG